MAIGMGVFNCSHCGIGINVERNYARCSGSGRRQGEDPRPRAHVSHSFADQIYARKELREKFARKKVSGVKNRRPHRQAETCYANHRCFTTFEDEMIREKMNGRAEKLLRSASRRGGALQGVPVSCCHVWSKSDSRGKSSMNGLRLPKKRQPGLGHLCYTLRTYSNASCQRHLFDEAHRSLSSDYPAQDPISSQIPSAPREQQPDMHHAPG